MRRSRIWRSFGVLRFAPAPQDDGNRYRNINNERSISWYELTLQILRRLSPWIVLVALLFAAEPLLHNHPLDSGASTLAGNNACVVCAAGVGRLPTAVPVVGIPQAIEFAQTVIVTSFIATETVSPRSPRAPPAA